MLPLSRIGGTLSAVLLCCLAVLPSPAAAATLTLQDIKAAVLSPDNLHKYKSELLCLLFIAFYGLVYLKGSTTCRKLALSPPTQTQQLLSGQRAPWCANG